MNRHRRFFCRYGSPLLICSLLLLLISAILFSPDGSAHFRVLESIARSLDTGLNWGRQCLTGSIRYPMLSTLWTWLCIHAGSGARLMMILPAFGCLHFLCRWYFEHRLTEGFSLIDTLTLGLTVLLFIYASKLGFQAGPEAFLLTGTVFYILRYFENENHLGNLVMAAFCTGLLSLCGFLTVLYTALLLLAINMGEGFLNNARPGIRLNLCLPFCYGLLLILVLNRLIMGNSLFYFHEAFLWTSHCTWNSFLQTAGIIGVLKLNLPGMIFPVLLMLHRNRNCRRNGKLLFLACLLVILQEILRIAMSFQSERMQLCLLLEFWAAMILLLQTNRQIKYSLQQAGIVMLLILIAAFHYREQDCLAAPTLSGNKVQASWTSRNALEKYIDDYWKDARVILLGDRLPALFNDYYEKRYVSRLDYQKWEILKQAEDEQLYLLLPPPESGYYPGGKNSSLANLYENGAPWLLLEKQFPEGWQLLRVVLPPKGESRLEKFL